MFPRAHLLRRQFFPNVTNLYFRPCSLYRTINTSQTLSSIVTNTPPSPSWPSIPYDATIPPSPSPSPPPPPPPPQQKISWRPYILSSISICIGLGAGELFSLTLVPPEFPAPDTAADDQLLKGLNTEMDKLEIVRAMRHTDGWIELSEHVVTGMGTVLRGFGRLGVQKIFANPSTGEVLALVWFGGGVTGWPGVAHGGVIATLLEDIMGLGPYVLALHGKEHISPLPPPHCPRSFGLTYVKPTTANQIYIVRASPSSPSTDKVQGISPLPSAPPPSHDAAPSKSWYSLAWLSREKDMTKRVESEWIERDLHRELELDATLEMLDGKVCVRAKGIWMTR